MSDFTATSHGHVTALSSTECSWKWASSASNGEWAWLQNAEYT